MLEVEKEVWEAARALYGAQVVRSLKGMVNTWSTKEQMAVLRFFEKRGFEIKTIIDDLGDVIDIVRLPPGAVIISAREALQSEEDRVFKAAHYYRAGFSREEIFRLFKVIITS